MRTLFLALLGLFFVVGSTKAEVPEIIESFNPSRASPVWVSADAARTATGINPTFFAPEDLSSIEGALARNQLRTDNEHASQEEPRAECQTWVSLTVDWENPRPNDSLDALFRHSKAIYAGTVSDIEQGFYFGNPGSILEVQVSDAPKYPGRRPPSVVLVFIQYAEIPIGDGMICARAGRDEVPRLGARMLVFSYRTLGDDRAEVIFPDDEEIIFETVEGLSLPSRELKGMPPDLSFAELLEAVESKSGVSR